MNLIHATRRTLATTLAEAQKTLPQAERATNIPPLTEAALVLVRAVRCMLRRATPELIDAYTDRLTPEVSGANPRSG